MTHPYNECSSTSIDVLNDLNPKAKDQVGILIICLFSILGLGYMCFNPIFQNNSSSSKHTTSFQKKISAASLNSEKTATHLLMNASNSTSSLKVINATSLAADAVH